MLLPARAEVARQLRRYRAWERVMLAAPADRAVRATFEDSGHTLCALMGKRCAREAADAAERYLRTNAVTCPQEARPREARPQGARLREARPQEARPQEQKERGRPAGAVRRSPPVADRRSPAGR
ncbi:DUF5133 domain-containing protein [Streptomyces sp. NPDC052701]|uniref:DUF5133 domain-containing protein n=1 Tax=Streptomyces sp. NPDC052701 TaxID=3155533 RepID=UPI003413C682